MQVLSTYDNANDIDGTSGCPHVQILTVIAHITEDEALLPESNLLALMGAEDYQEVTIKRGLTTNRLYAKAIAY